MKNLQQKNNIFVHERIDGDSFFKAILNNEGWVLQILRHTKNPNPASENKLIYTVVGTEKIGLNDPLGLQSFLEHHELDDKMNHYAQLMDDKMTGRLGISGEGKEK